MKRKVVLCVLNKPYTYEKGKIGNECLYFTEKTMNFDNRSFSILRKIFPKPEFELYSTNVDNILGFSPNCTAKETNANVPKLIKKFKAQIVVFGGIKSKKYYWTIKDKINCNIILMPHPSWRLFTIKLRNKITKIAQNNNCFKKELIQKNSTISTLNLK